MFLVKSETSTDGLLVACKGGAVYCGKLRTGGEVWEKLAKETNCVIGIFFSLKVKTYTDEESN